MRWNLRFRSYPDVDAQRFAAPNLHSTCAKIHFGDYRVWQALQGMCDIGHRRWGRASLQILDISTPKSATPEKSSSIFAVPIVGGTPRLVLKDVNIWNVQCARLPSTVCMYSTTKGNVVETYRFDVKSGKSTGPAQIDPPCNWSLWQSSGPAPFQQFHRVCNPLTRWAITGHIGGQHRPKCVADGEFQMITRSMERTIGVYPNPRVLKYTRLTRYRSTRELACASLDAPFGTCPDCERMTATRKSFLQVSIRHAWFVAKPVSCPCQNQLGDYPVNQDSGFRSHGTWLVAACGNQLEHSAGHKCQKSSEPSIR